MTIFNDKIVDHTKEYMFFGEPLNTARYDKMKFSKFDHLTEQQLGYFWRPTEIDISKDVNDFQNKMSDVDRRVYIHNLQYQTLLDSIQGRSPSRVFEPICSLPELENWLTTWTFSESVHSRSYTYIIRNVFNDPSKVFDDIMLTPEIMNRASMVTEHYERLEQAINDDLISMREKKKLLIRCMFSVHALEAIRFYVSFACSFSFVERGLMEGSGKILKLIARDEYLHQGGTHFIISRWIKGLDDPEMTEIFEEDKEFLVGIILDTYQQECEWAEFLFKDGSIRGLNTTVLQQYLRYLTDKSLTTLGLPASFGDVKENPLPWIDSYLKSSSTQVAPQEVELSSYQIGSIDMNDDLSGITL